MTDFKPGFYPNVREQDYLSGAFGPDGGSISASGVKTLLRSPKLFKHREHDPWTGSDATRLGTVVHELLLGTGPGYLIVPPNGRTKDAREAHHGAVAEAEASGKAYVNEEQWRHAQNAAEAVMNDPEASALIGAPGDAEISGYTTDDDTGLWLRCRFDKLRADNLGVDIKTARDASPEGFARACFNLGYHVSAAFYEAIADDLGRKLTDYKFLVVEPQPPYHVAVYRLDDEAMALGRMRAREGLDRYAECLRTNTWPGYEKPVDNAICLPAYAYTELDLVI